MAMAAFHMTAPAVAAAVGIYFFDKIHSNTKDVGGGQRISKANLVDKTPEKVKKNSQIPRLAPQFDGLYSFETLVG